MAIRSSFVIVLANLGGRDHVALVLDGSGSEQNLPVSFARWHSERARKLKNLSSEFPLQGAHLREPKVKTLKKSSHLKSKIKLQDSETRFLQFR